MAAAAPLTKEAGEAAVAAIIIPFKIK